jgi:hypothetical protein
MRIAALLGMENTTRRNLSQLKLGDDVTITGNLANGFRFTIKHGQQTLLSSAKSVATKTEASNAALNALIAATVSSSYQDQAATNGKLFFNIVEDQQLLARHGRQFDNQTDLAVAKDSVLKFARTNYSVEGLYLIENILLRPLTPAANEPTMPICVDTDCEDCTELDPYSYRLHVVLPAYGERFMDMQFREYAESVIRREMPAHILPKICWAGRADIAELELAYRAWLGVISGASSGDRRNKISTLIERLFSTKSIYPTEQLVDCDDTSNDARFIVGRTTLGSLDSDE